MPINFVHADEFRLPAPGVMVHLSPEFNPPILKGIKVHPDNPFRFDFILDTGDTPTRGQGNVSLRGAEGDAAISKEEIASPKKQASNDAMLKQEANKLIKYFLASLTIPEKDLWVNLSPYEKDRIIPNSFGLTEMGRDLLAQDYMLKQITASLIYPEDELGKKFWKRIYEEAAKKYGTTNIPVNTFNKVWIVPEKAVVYENAKSGTAYVVESTLKVMLEQDYLSISKHSAASLRDSRAIANQTVSLRGSETTEAISKRTTNSVEIASSPSAPRNDTSELGSQIIREVVIPELTKEINNNKNFAQLRQVYNSLILATWYKKKIKDSILAQVYADKNKIQGIGYKTDSPPLVGGRKASLGPRPFTGARGGGENANSPLPNPPHQGGGNNDVEFIYQRYLAAFKKGVYNFIKEELDPLTQRTIPKKYFSGGVMFSLNNPVRDNMGRVAEVLSYVSEVPTAAMIAQDHAMLITAETQQAGSSKDVRSPTQWPTISKKKTDLPGFIDTKKYVSVSQRTGEATLFLFDIFNLDLSLTEREFIVGYINEHPDSHLALVKGALIEKAQGQPLEVSFSELLENAIVPGSIKTQLEVKTGVKVRIGDNSPFILENAPSSSTLEELPKDKDFIRVSASNLIRIKVGDYYLLSFNKKGLSKGDYRLTPPGGAYEFLDEQGMAHYRELLTDEPNAKKPLDVRRSVRIGENQEQLRKFVENFNNGLGVEVDWLREFIEELGPVSREEKLFKDETALPKFVPIQKWREAITNVEIAYALQDIDEGNLDGARSTLEQLIQRGVSIKALNPLAERILKAGSTTKDSEKPQEPNVELVNKAMIIPSQSAIEIPELLLKLSSSNSDIKSACEKLSSIPRKSIFKITEVIAPFNIAANEILKLEDRNEKIKAMAELFRIVQVRIDLILAEYPYGYGSIAGRQFAEEIRENYNFKKSGELREEAYKEIIKAIRSSGLASDVVRQLIASVQLQTSLSIQETKISEDLPNNARIRFLMTDGGLQRTVEALSIIRLFFDFDINLGQFPLESSYNDPNLIFEIAPGVFVTPVSHSYRRFILFEKDENSQPINPIEIKIPGQEWSRYYVSDKDYMIGMQISETYGSNKLAPDPLFIIKAQGVVNIYGRNVQFNDEPLQVIGSKYTPGLRIQENIAGSINISQVAKDEKWKNDPQARARSYDTIIKALGNKYQEIYGGHIKALQQDIMYKIMRVIRAVHGLGYVGSTYQPGMGTDMHLGNMKVVVDDKGINVQWVNDNESLIPISRVAVPDKIMKKEIYYPIGMTDIYVGHTKDLQDEKNAIEVLAAKADLELEHIKEEQRIKLSKDLGSKTTKVTGRLGARRSSSVYVFGRNKLFPNESGRNGQSTALRKAVVLENSGVPGAFDAAMTIEQAQKSYREAVIEFYTKHSNGAEGHLMQAKGQLVTQAIEENDRDVREYFVSALEGFDPRRSGYINEMQHNDQVIELMLKQIAASKTTGFVKALEDNRIKPQTSVNTSMDWWFTKEDLLNIGIKKAEIIFLLTEFSRDLISELKEVTILDGSIDQKFGLRLNQHDDLTTLFKEYLRSVANETGSQQQRINTVNARATQTKEGDHYVIHINFNSPLNFPRSVAAVILRGLFPLDMNITPIVISESRRSPNQPLQTVSFFVQDSLFKESEGKDVQVLIYDAAMQTDPWLLHPKNYYDIMGFLGIISDPDVIKKRFREKSKEYHPDKYHDQPSEVRAKAEEWFKLLNEAYEVLSDPDKKARYDIWHLERYTEKSTKTATAMKSTTTSIPKDFVAVKFHTDNITFRLFNYEESRYWSIAGREDSNEAILYFDYGWKGWGAPRNRLGSVLSVVIERIGNVPGLEIGGLHLDSNYSYRQAWENFKTPQEYKDPGRIQLYVEIKDVTGSLKILRIDLMKDEKRIKAGLKIEDFILPEQEKVEFMQTLRSSPKIFHLILPKVMSKSALQKYYDTVIKPHDYTHNEDARIPGIVTVLGDGSVRLRQLSGYKVRIDNIMSIVYVKDFLSGVLYLKGYHPDGFIYYKFEAKYNSVYTDRLDMPHYSHREIETIKKDKISPKILEELDKDQAMMTQAERVLEVIDTVSHKFPEFDSARISKVIKKLIRDCPEFELKDGHFNRLTEWLISSKTERELEVRLIVLEKTQRISLRDFYETLKVLVPQVNSAVQEAVDRSGHYSVMLDDPLHGSRKWVWSIFKLLGWVKTSPIKVAEELNENSVKDTVKQRIKEIFLFDDISYSGNRLVEDISKINLGYKLEGKAVPRITLIVVYMSQQSRRMIERLFPNQIKIISNNTIPSFLEEMTSAGVTRDELKQALPSGVPWSGSTVYPEYKIAPDQDSFPTDLRVIMQSSVPSYKSGTALETPNDLWVGFENPTIPSRAQLANLVIPAEDQAMLSSKSFPKENEESEPVLLEPPVAIEVMESAKVRLPLGQVKSILILYEGDDQQQQSLMVDVHRYEDNKVLVRQSKNIYDLENNGDPLSIDQNGLSLNLKLSGNLLVVQSENRPAKVMVGAPVNVPLVSKEGKTITLGDMIYTLGRKRGGLEAVSLKASDYKLAREKPETKRPKFFTVKAPEPSFLEDALHRLKLLLPERMQTFKGDSWEAVAVISNLLSSTVVFLNQNSTGPIPLVNGDRAEQLEIYKSIVQPTTSNVVLTAEKSVSVPVANLHAIKLVSSSNFITENDINSATGVLYKNQSAILNFFRIHIARFLRIDGERFYLPKWGSHIKTENSSRFEPNGKWSQFSDYLKNLFNYRLTELFLLLRSRAIDGSLYVEESKLRTYEIEGDVEGKDVARSSMGWKETCLSDLIEVGFINGELKLSLTKKAQGIMSSLNLEITTKEFETDNLLESEFMDALHSRDFTSAGSILRRMRRTFANIFINYYTEILNYERNIFLQEWSNLFEERLTSSDFDGAENILNIAENTIGNNPDIEQKRARLKQARESGAGDAGGAGNPSFGQYKGRDPYLVLGVPRDADEDLIKKAFRELSRIHPDRYQFKLVINLKQVFGNEAEQILNIFKRSRADDTKLEKFDLDDLLRIKNYLVDFKDQQEDYFLNMIDQYWRLFVDERDGPFKQTEEKFKEISAAYEALSDPVKRAEYDKRQASKAMTVMVAKRNHGRTHETNTGGIDLTPANMNLQTQNNGDEIEFHMDSAMLAKLQNAPGFTPVIINIQPLTDLRQFLGMPSEISTIVQ